MRQSNGVYPKWSVLAAIVISSGLATEVLAQATDTNLKVSDKSVPYRGALLQADQINDGRLAQLRDEGFNAIVLVLSAVDGEARTLEVRAARKVISNAAFELGYWVEVARCPELADAHPDWMASLQTHDEWRRFFPDTPEPHVNEVVKTYPWVPILSREPFSAQLDRVKQLLAERPAATRLFLNDLQGAPSACGCGNTLCRWTSDYGDRRTTVPLGDDAAVLFVSAIKKSVPETTVVPVWTTECEEHDGAPDGQCAGVGCFRGICWKAYTQQLGPIEQSCDQIGAFVPYKLFERDLPIYGEDAGWIQHAVESFTTMPPQHGGRRIRPRRLTTILQGWDVDRQQVVRQIEVARRAKVGGYVVAFSKLEQSWKPVIGRHK